MESAMVYFNGDLLSQEEFCPSPFNRGLHYGDGVFETMRSYGGQVFRLKKHLSRLTRGMEALSIKSEFDRATIAQAIAATLTANNLADAQVKIIAYRQGGEGPSPSPNAGADLLIMTRPFDSSRKKRCEQGISAHIVSIRRNTTSPLAGIKSLNYLDNILGRIESRTHNADEALFLNISGSVAEGATSNIFIVQKGTLCTPPQEAGILAGITREAVLEIAGQASIPHKEKDLAAEEIGAADEAFLTNSLMEIMPLVRVNTRPIGGAGQPGEVTRKLMRYYSDLVKKELNEDSRRPIH